MTGDFYKNGVIFSGGSGSSQWGNGTGGNIFYTGGNVGIGTTSPSTILHIARSTASTVIPTTTPSGSAIFSFIDRNNPASFFGFVGGVTSNGLAWLQSKYTTGESATLPMALQPLGGNVGIGTTSPSNALHVRNTGGIGQPVGSGTTQTFGIQRIQPSGDNVCLDIGSHGGTGNWFQSTLATDLSQTFPLLLNPRGGNVGIGTSSPSQRLTVVADGLGSNSNAQIYIRGGTDQNKCLMMGYDTSNNYGYVSALEHGVAWRHLCLQHSGTGNVGIGTTAPTSTLQVNGSLSKSSGTFDIPHPSQENKRLVHSFVEGPRVDLIYRGTVQLQNGTATVNLDTDCVEEPDCAMTEGTFEALCRNPQYFLQNHSSFDRVKGSISGNILTITCENTSSTDTIYWSVIAERKDPFIYEWERTNANGYLKTEYTQEQQSPQ